MKQRWRTVTAAMLAVAGAVIACDGAVIDPPDLSVRLVEVLPAGPLDLVVGDTVHLTVYPKLADGTVHGSLVPQWATEAPAVAGLIPHARTPYIVVLEALAPGNTRIQVLAGGRDTTVVVRIAVAPGVTGHVTWTGSSETYKQRLVLEAPLLQAGLGLVQGR
jgi:hypothetical protein